MSKDKPSLGTGLNSLLGERSKTSPQGVGRDSYRGLVSRPIPTKKKDVQKHTRRVSTKYKRAGGVAAAGRKEAGVWKV